MASSIGCGGEAPDQSPPSRLRTMGSREGLVLADYFDDAQVEAAVLLGQRYLAVVAPTASGPQVAALLAPTVELLTAAPSEALALSALRARILADFADGGTMLLDGWTFSVTELQVCALVTSLSA